LWLALDVFVEIGHRRIDPTGAKVFAAADIPTKRGRAGLLNSACEQTNGTIVLPALAGFGRLLQKLVNVLTDAASWREQQPYHGNRR
jgi:hypothetical protein